MLDYTEVIVGALTTAGTVLGSSAAWKFWEKRAGEKAKQAEMDRKDENLFRDDLRERVAALEAKLEKSDKEKQNLQKEVIKLVEKIAMLSVEVEFLRKENTELREKLGYAGND